MPTIGKRANANFLNRHSFKTPVKERTCTLLVAGIVQNTQRSKRLSIRGSEHELTDTRDVLVQSTTLLSPLPFSLPRSLFHERPDAGAAAVADLYDNHSTRNDHDQRAVLASHILWAEYTPGHRLGVWRAHFACYDGNDTLRNTRV